MMTLKNLRDLHYSICPANDKQSESETVVEPIPEKPKLVRSVTVEPKREEVEPEEVKPKAKKTIKKVKFRRNQKLKSLWFRRNQKQL